MTVKPEILLLRLLSPFVCILMTFMLFSVSFSAVLPQDFNYSSRAEALLDAGYLWKYNSLIHPLDISPDSAQTNPPFSSFGWLIDNLQSTQPPPDFYSDDGKIHGRILAGFGLSYQSAAGKVYNGLAMQAYFWNETVFKKNFYLRLCIRAADKPSSLPHYTATYESVDHVGFNNGEIDQSVLGFRNSWANIEYGRSREIWGTQTQDNLILSGNSPAYERLLLQLNYKSLTYRWFYGFLDAISSDAGNVQRYIAGRMIEYNNHSNLILGISETSVFAGIDRPPDMAFLNPIAFHFDIDLNDRGNYPVNKDNAIWGLYCDYLPLPNLRISGSLAIDEFQIDAADREAGAADGLAYFGRVSWTPAYRPFGITIFVQALRLDTYFGQHISGWANLVTRDNFIGHPLGNDADSYSLGIRLIFPGKTLFELQFGQLRKGANSLLSDPYDPESEYLAVDFPSSPYITNGFLKLSLDTQPLKNLTLDFASHIDIVSSGENSSLEKYTLTLIYLFHKNFIR